MSSHTLSKASRPSRSKGVGTKVVKAGEAIYTPPNTPHYGRNATDKESKTVVVRIKAKNQPVMVELKR
jgi:uncharacterized RmlC-like cupin family protein